MATDQLGTGLPWIDAIAASFPQHSFEQFHTRDLPALNARHGSLVVDDLNGVPPLTFQLPDGTAYTWRATATGVAVSPGDTDAATLVVGAFLFGLGVGSLIGALIADRLSTRGSVHSVCTLAWTSAEARHSAEASTVA